MKKSTLVSMMLCSFILLTFNQKSYSQYTNADFATFANKYKNTIFDSQYAAPARFAEFARCGPDYCMFTEGVGYVHSAGYDVAVPVANYAFLSTQIFKSERDTAWHKTKERMYIDLPQYEYISDLPPSYSSLFTSLRRFEKHGPINNPRNFDIEKVDDELVEGMVSFRFNQIRRFDRAPYSGILHFHENTGLIAKAELDQTAFYLNNYRTWMTASAAITYFDVDGAVFVGSADIVAKYQELKLRVLFESDAPIEKNQEYTDREFYNFGNNNYNPFVPPLEPLDEFSSYFNQVPIADIKRDLEVEKSLEEQFVLNSNQPFKMFTQHDGTLAFGHGGDLVFDFINTVLQRIMSNEVPKQGFLPKAEPLQIYERIYDFERLPKDSVVENVFMLKNISDYAIGIKSINPDCSFMSIDETQYVNEILPGETLKIATKLRLRNRGPLISQVVIEADTEQRFYSFIVRGYVQ